MGRSFRGKVERGTKGTPDLIHVELNMEEAPLFSSSTQNQDVIELLVDVVTDGGEALERKWRVSASREYGFPGPFEEDLWVAVGKLVQSRGGMPEDGRLQFSLYELIQILGLPKKGDNYPKVRDAILRIQKTQVDAINAFYSKEKLSYESEHFNPWRVHFEANADRFGRASERHTLRFDEVLVRSFRAGHMKPLDIDFYLSLKNSYSKSLYRRIDGKRGDGLRWTIKLGMLKQLLSMPASYKSPSKIKEKLERAHAELTRRGYLCSVTFPGKDEVRYEVSRDFVEQRVALERAWSPEENAAVRTLIRNGVWPNVARELVVTQGPDTCNLYVEALPYQKGVRNPGAWLKKFIEERLPLPIEPPQRKLEEAKLAPSVAAFDMRPKSPEPVADPEAEELWEEVLSKSAEEIDAPSWRVWFEGTIPVAVGDSVLTISVPNSFAEEYISSRFGDILENHIRILRGEGWIIRIVVVGRERDAG